MYHVADLFMSLLVDRMVCFGCLPGHTGLHAWCTTPAGAPSRSLALLELDRGEWKESVETE